MSSEFNDDLEDELDDEMGYDTEEYDSPQAAVKDACYGAKLFSELADFAPIHAAMAYIASKVRSAGFNADETEGKQILLDVASTMIPDPSVMEHNPWLACFYCPNEVMPAVDGKFLQRYLDYEERKIELQEFYRCPECGGPINVSRKRCEPDRHLPWFHYKHGCDFDVADEDKPHK